MAPYRQNLGHRLVGNKLRIAGLDVGEIGETGVGETGVRSQLIRKRKENGVRAQFLRGGKISRMLRFSHSALQLEGKLTATLMPCHPARVDHHAAGANTYGHLRFGDALRPHGPRESMRRIISHLDTHQSTHHFGKHCFVQSFPSTARTMAKERK